MRFDEQDLRRVAWLRRRRELETRRMARTRAQQRDQRAADHDARIHRCGGCGQWLYGPVECDVCLKISQLHEQDARRRRTPQ